MTVTAPQLIENLKKQLDRELRDYLFTAVENGDGGTIVLQFLPGGFVGDPKITVNSGRHRRDRPLAPVG